MKPEQLPFSDLDDAMELEAYACEECGHPAHETACPVCGCEEPTDDYVPIPPRRGPGRG